MPKTKRQFASDNWAGMCPEAVEALLEANVGHTPSYGEDRYTQEASDLLREFFETDCEVFFTFNGTAANSLALASLCSSYHSILCHEHAHLETDECGAPEFFAHGTKVLLIPGDGGKVNLEEVERAVLRRTDIHYPRPKVLSLTQATELGTVYTPDELKEAWRFARNHKLRIHMDGARLANALATLDVSPRHITWEAGVDVLCFGGTKIGLPVGDAVIFFNRELAHEFDYRCKQAGQLASKMRFLAAPWIGILKENRLLHYARNANACAQRLAAFLKSVPNISLMYPTQANAVFAELPPSVIRGLRDRGWEIYTFIGAGGARFMCSWDTTEEDVDELCADIAQLCSEAKA